METDEARRLLEDLSRETGQVLARHRERLELVRAALKGVGRDENTSRRDRVLKAAGRLLTESAGRLEDRLRTDVLSEARERLSRELPPERRDRIRRGVREGRDGG